jgi:hypothetical protein
MLEKQPKSEALKKREDRRQMQVKDVPPSIPGKLWIIRLEEFLSI